MLVRVWRVNDTAGQYHPLLIGNKYAAGNIYSALQERRTYQQEVHQYFQLCRFLYFFSRCHVCLTHSVRIYL
jgi:hypothetical protein